MRWERIEEGGVVWINDAYNANPLSMQKSVETFASMDSRGGRKIAVLGDMLELGEKDAEFHEELEKILRNTKQNEILLYGPLMKSLYEKIRDMNVFHFEDKSFIREKLREYDTKKLAVLLKGSRGMRLEEIIEEGN